MESYKRGSHPVWDCKYHIVWVTKYRFPILGGDVGQRCRELIRETLLAEFASLRKRYWGQHLRARGYWVASSGNVTDEIWAEYIKTDLTSM